MPLTVHPDIESLVPYVPGKPIEEIERELGIPRAIKLASNENPLGPSPKALAVLGTAAQTLNRYPDGGGHRLRHALAARHKVSADHIILGNGSDEILGLLARAFLAPGEEAVMADQTFVIYKMEVTAAHGKPVLVRMREWRHDLDAMLQAVTPRTRLLFLCNPNNPTGAMITAAELDRLMAALPPDVIVVSDEAYCEYVRAGDFPDSLRYVRQGRNLVVLRTFSKIYGMAGLRIGYGVMTPEIAGYLNRVRPPFNANSLAQAAALAALDDEEHVARTRALTHAELDTMQAALTARGFRPAPSQANFVFFDCGQDGRGVFQALLKRGIIIRHIEGPMIRVSIGLPEENRQFLDAFASVCAGPSEGRGKRDI